MAAWGRKKEEPAKPKIEIPEPWPCAKQITKAEAESKSVPLGWYFYQDGYMWRGLRPNPETGEHDPYSPSKSRPEELAEWLGVPVTRGVPARKAALDNTVRRSEARAEGPAAPVGGENVLAAIAAANKARQPDPDFLERMGLAETKEPAQPSDEEKQWAEEVALEELKDPPPPLEEKQRKKRKTLGRTHQIKTRLTDGELKTFNARVKKSGLSQGDYLRSAALNGQIVVQESSPADMALLDEVALLRAELGRQGGLLKMVIKPNEGQRELAPEEWAELIQTVRDMEQIKRKLSDLEVKIANGNHKAPNK